MSNLRRPTFFSRLGLHTVLGILVITSVTPFVWALMQSTKLTRDAVAREPVLWGWELTSSAYNAFWFDGEEANMWGVVLYSLLKYPHNDDQSITTRINLVNLGNAQILTIPGEALPNIGFYLKRKMGGEHNLLFGLTNDAFGYIMTKEDFSSFPRYDYISRVSLGEMTGEILLETSLNLVAEAAHAKAP